MYDKSTCFPRRCCLFFQDVGYEKKKIEDKEGGGGGWEKKERKKNSFRLVIRLRCLICIRIDERNRLLLLFSLPRNRKILVRVSRSFDSRFDALAERSHIFADILLFRRHFMRFFSSHISTHRAFAEIGINATRNFRLIQIKFHFYPMIQLYFRDLGV